MFLSKALYRGGTAGGKKKKDRKKDVARIVFKISRDCGLFWRLLSARSGVEAVNCSFAECRVGAATTARSGV